MATLTFVDVECVKKQDTVGSDKIHVHVGGVHLKGPLSMGKKDVYTFPPNTNHIFNNSVEIELIEVDGAFGGSNDESLGTHTVTAAQAGGGTLTGYFHRLSGADYHLRYKVK